MGTARSRWDVARGLGRPVAERGKRGEEERPSGVGPAVGWASCGVEQARAKLRGKGGASRAGPEMRGGSVFYFSNLSYFPFSIQIQI